MMSMVLKQAMRSLLAAPFRSFLTILGVIIGISSVVMFMSLGEGLRAAVTNEITSLGSNLLIIIPGQYEDSSSFSPNVISGDILKLEDMTAIEQLESTEKVAPMMLVGGVLRRDQTPAPTALTLGTTTSFPDVFSTISVDKGRFFSDQENTDRARVMVLGPSIAQTLFGDADPIGQNVTFGKETMTVIGVTKVPESASFVGSSDYGNMTMMPIETAGELTGGVKIMRILAKLNPEANVKTEQARVKETLLVRHAADEFSVLTQEDVVGVLDTVLNALTAAIAAIAAISLIVAGVGIMNIMLVSVTERTREIGLRKAIGATQSSILTQFLIEAIVLTVTGALIAIALAFIAAQLMAQFSPITPIVTPLAVFLAVSVSVVVGLVFGLAPAVRASQLDPIRSLRYE